MANKKKPLHPGEMLLIAYLEPLKMTQADFAKHLGWTYARLNEIIKAKRGISADSALAFSEALGTDPEYWLMLQSHWDLWHAEKNHEPIKKIEYNF
jgi:antitoxin HigA-1